MKKTPQTFKGSVLNEMKVMTSMQIKQKEMGKKIDSILGMSFYSKDSDWEYLKNATNEKFDIIVATDNPMLEKIIDEEFQNFDDINLRIIALNVLRLMKKGVYDCANSIARNPSNRDLLHLNENLSNHLITAFDILFKKLQTAIEKKPILMQGKKVKAKSKKPSISQQLTKSFYDMI